MSFFFVCLEEEAEDLAAFFVGVLDVWPFSFILLRILLNSTDILFPKLVFWLGEVGQFSVVP